MLAASEQQGVSFKQHCPQTIYKATASPNISSTLDTARERLQLPGEHELLTECTVTQRYLSTCNCGTFFRPPNRQHKQHV